MHICMTLDCLVLQLDIKGAVKEPMCNCVKNIDRGIWEQAWYDTYNSFSHGVYVSYPLLR